MSGPLDRTNYNALTDDSGGNADGTIWNKNQVKIVTLDPVDALYTALAYSATGTQNNVNFDGGSVTAGGWVRVTSASDVTITGIANGADGRLLGIYNTGAGGNIFLAHNSGSSSAANRLANIATSGNTPIAARGWAIYRYDATSSLWRLVQHEQGAGITPTFAAGNFTGNVSMTWTVGSGDVNFFRYSLRGVYLTVSFSLVTTTVGGTPNTTLQIGNGAYGSFTTAGEQAVGIMVNDNGGGFVAGLAQTSSSTSTLISIFRASLANWSASTDNTTVRGQVTFEVT